MGILQRETDIIQNPALGSILIHRFVSSYREKSEQAVPMQLIFLILPMLYHKATLEMIDSTYESSGLRLLVSKFSKERNKDLLLSIHDQTLRMRELTMDSLRIALACDLVMLNLNDGKVNIASQSLPKKYDSQEMVKAAKKLGYWCASLTLHEISSILKVGF
ncbi:hypothetical protein J2Z48_002882 [Croceifilum oryzae]|uniref:Uncharacterized protein n=1 Tax=Croceifilum oryzae TaxID=1553429 RepID=A0AAJ1THP6_9BACL|nr:three component ABC system middle component [Croceifilum oryzae]MDQ0418679.1 hypothetical protein [Croceifilum oryzae]